MHSSTSEKYVVLSYSVICTDLADMGCLPFTQRVRPDHNSMGNTVSVENLGLPVTRRSVNFESLMARRVKIVMSL